MADFYKLNVEESLNELGVQQETGLDDTVVTQRREQYGPNVLPSEDGINWVSLIVSQFTDLMVIILIAAAIISIFVGDAKDAIVILIIVILNATLGIYQEYQAEQALAALSAMQVPRVRVRRNGTIVQISAEDVVVGDIVLLEEGDRIPADGRLIESVNLRIDEAALTGESQPVDKDLEALPSTKKVGVGDRYNMVFMGTTVVYGRGEMAVTGTGLQTEIGLIASMLLRVEQTETPLQRRLNQLGRYLALAAFILVGLIFVAGLLRGIPTQEMFITAISLAVAAVPEGLPALVTIGLSIGASRMVRRHALIRRLPAVETLGSTTVICSDKTGTLTRNEMTVTNLALPGHDDVEVTGIGYTTEGDFYDENGNRVQPKDDVSLARFLRAMTLSTNAYIDKENGNGNYEIVGDTTEGAMLIAAEKAGWTRDFFEKEMPRVGELPFSSERKAMTTLHSLEQSTSRNLFEDASFISITKGAPDRLLEWAEYEHVPDGTRKLSDDRRQIWQNRIDEMAQDGLRVLGVGYRKLKSVPEKLDEGIERELHLLGLIGILDPARPEAKDAVATARRAGIRTIMITGDHALTAESIARDLGILNPGEKAITGAELDEMDEKGIATAVQQTSCFARVSPEHKLKLVQTLQKQNQIVAMTGDGVNDAPALKQADIGVAMGITGTDVSKGAAEMVLTDDNFASIVAAVEEGRAIYDNIRKFIKYLLSSNVGEILVMFVALLVGLKIPLLAIQILWINLVTDGLPAIAVGFEPAEPDVMERKPRPMNESIFAQGTGRHIIWVGILIAILTLSGYLIGYSIQGLDPFNPSLNVETLSSAEIAEIVASDEIIPENWDSLPLDERRELLIEEENAAFAEEASGGILGEIEKLPRTIAFTILAFTQMFEIMGIHAGDRVPFFRVGFRDNRLLLWAVISTFVLQLLVIYTPFLQEAFETTALSITELLISLLLGSVVLVAVEIEKFIARRGDEKDQPVVLQPSN